MRLIKAILIGCLTLATSFVGAAQFQPILPSDTMVETRAKINSNFTGMGTSLTLASLTVTGSVVAATNYSTHYSALISNGVSAGASADLSVLLVARSGDIELTKISTDKGLTWSTITPTDIGFSNEDPPNWATVSGDGHTLILTYMGHPCVSHNGGAYNVQVAALGDIAKVVSSFDGSILYAKSAYVNAFVYKSVNYGATWTTVSTLPEPSLNITCSSNGQYVVCGADIPGLTSHSIKVSSDYGATWASHNIGRAPGSLVCSSSGQYVYSGSEYAGWIPHPLAYSTLRRSADYGATWAPVAGVTGVSSIAISPDGQRVICCTQRPSNPYVYDGAWYMSNDSGVTFTKMPTSWRVYTADSYLIQSDLYISNDKLYAFNAPEVRQLSSTAGVVIGSINLLGPTGQTNLIYANTNGYVHMPATEFTNAPQVNGTNLALANIETMQTVFDRSNVIQAVSSKGFDIHSLADNVSPYLQLKWIWDGSTSNYFRMYMNVDSLVGYIATKNVFTVSSNGDFTVPGNLASKGTVQLNDLRITNGGSQVVLQPTNGSSEYVGALLLTSATDASAMGGSPSVYMSPTNSTAPFLYLNSGAKPGSYISLNVSNQLSMKLSTNVITVYTNVVPAVSNVLTLGTSLLPFKALYLGPASIYMGGTNVMSYTNGGLSMNVPLSNSGTYYGNAYGLTNFSATIQPYIGGYSITNYVNITNGSYQYYAPTTTSTLAMPACATTAAYNVWIDVEPNTNSFTILTNNVLFTTNDVLGNGAASIYIRTNGVTPLLFTKSYNSVNWRVYSL